MMILLAALFMTLGSGTGNDKTDKPMTQVDVCRQFNPPVVEIDAFIERKPNNGDGIAINYSRGTGFIVSSDGLILTAAHLLINPDTGKAFDSITVHSLPDGSTAPATLVVPLNETVVHDFALLHVDKSNLPSLPLGNENDVIDGSPIAIIGFPLSVGLKLPIKFCLSGTVVAKVGVGIKGSTQLNVIFFQGVSIKGISGAPIISLNTGRVVGIENLRLTGIGPALEQTKKDTEAAVRSGSSVSIMGVNLAPTLYNVIDVLDTQLANGLGAGNGITAARLTIEKARKENKK